MIAVIVFVVVFFGFGLFSFFHGGEDSSVLDKKEQKKETELEQKAQVDVDTDMVYENLEGLFFLNEEGTTVFKEHLENWLKFEGLRVSYVRVLGNTELGTEDILSGQELSYIFYLECDAGQYIKGIYGSGEYIFQFISELPFAEDVDEVTPEKTLEEQKQEAEAVRESYKGTPMGDDAGDVVLLNKDVLPGELSAEQLVFDMTGFLEQEGELRREVSFVEQTEEGYLFSFRNQRLDGKELLVTVSDGNYLIMFVGGK